MPKGEHLRGETRHRENEAQAARLAVAYLPKGRIFIVHRDSPQYPVRFLNERNRNSWLNTFYCNDKRLVKHAFRQAKKFGWTS